MVSRRVAPSFALFALALVTVLALGPGAPPVAADEPAAPAALKVDSWLVLGPVEVPLPAFHDAERHGALPADLLAVAGPTGGAPWPAAGDEMALPDGGRETWRRVTADGEALSLGDLGAGTGARLAWLAARVDGQTATRARRGAFRRFLVRHCSPLGLRGRSAVPDQLVVDGIEQRLE